MGRETAIAIFIEQDLKEGNIIEAERRRDAVREALHAAVRTHAPAVVVKIGVGEGSLACSVAEIVKKLVIVEPSYDALATFARKHASTPGFENIELVNGTPEALPIDYYKADMVVILDYLDLFDSYRAVEEIVRVLRYEGTLFFGGVVLSNDDVDGVYDEFVHAANPYHNDYYLQSDLETFMRLKGFTAISRESLRTKISLTPWLAAWERYGSDGSDPLAARRVISDSSELFTSLYGWDGIDTLDEIYCTALFRKNAYTPQEGKP